MSEKTTYQMPPRRGDRAMSTAERLAAEARRQDALKTQIRNAQRRTA